VWLTFYLSAEPARLGPLADDLAKIGGSNLDGAEGAFLYAKMPVRLDAADIQRVAADVSAMAATHQVDLDLIDLDSSPEVSRARFFTLYKARH
jgi:hypothetical protein